VLLSAQRVDEPTDLVELAQHMLQFGAVAQGHHRAEFAARPGGPPNAADKDPTSVVQEPVRDASTAIVEDQCAQLTFGEDVGYRPADVVGGCFEQLVRLVIEQTEVAAVVDGHHALTNAVQGGLPFLQQCGDLVEL